jgi:uncharacterized protein (DUF3820 family)
MSNTFDDQTIMPFGKKHKGKRLIEIPDDYFIWFWGENKQAYLNNELHPDGDKFAMMKYIDHSFEDLP